MYTNIVANLARTARTTQFASSAPFICPLHSTVFQFEISHARAHFNGGRTLLKKGGKKCVTSQLVPSSEHILCIYISALIYGLAVGLAVEL